jgi:hypothetical protein
MKENWTQNNNGGSFGPATLHADGAFSLPNGMRFAQSCGFENTTFGDARVDKAPCHAEELAGAGTKDHKLPSKQECERLAHEKHGQFVRWLEVATQFVKEHRGDHYESVQSLEQIPAFAIGVTESVSKSQFDIPLLWRSNKADFCVYLLKVFIAYADGIYDGEYFLCRDSGTSAPNVVIFRILPNGEIGIFQITLSLDGNIAAAQVTYSGYSLYDPEGTEWIDKQFGLLGNFAKMAPSRSYWKDGKQHIGYKVESYDGTFGSMVGIVLGCLIIWPFIPFYIYFIVKFHLKNGRNRRECLLMRVKTRPSPALTRLAPYGELIGAPESVEHRLFSQRLQAALNEVVGRVIEAA